MTTPSPEKTTSIYMPFPRNRVTAADVLIAVNAIIAELGEGTSVTFVAPQSGYPGEILGMRGSKTEPFRPSLPTFDRHGPIPPTDLRDPITKLDDLQDRIAADVAKVLDDTVR